MNQATNHPKTLGKQQIADVFGIHLTRLQDVFTPEVLTFMKINVDTYKTRKRFTGLECQRLCEILKITTKDVDDLID